MATVGPALFPSGATWPGTAVYAGQGAWPLVRVQVATGDFVNPALAVWPDTNVFPGAAVWPGPGAGWYDVTDRVREWSLSRGRSNELDQFEAGTCTVVLGNRDRAWDPLMGVNVRPTNKIYVFAEFSGQVFPLFRGLVEAWQQAWPGPGTSDALASISAVDETKQLAAVKLPASGTLAAGTISEAVTAILNQSGSQAPREINTSAQALTVSYAYTGQYGWAAASDLGKSDYAQISAVNYADAGLYVTASGTIRYLEASYRQRSGSPGQSVQAVFGDQGELPYLNLTTDYSDALLVNTWVMTGTSSSTRTATDTASISTYGQRTSTRTVWFDISGVPGANLAACLLDKYKQPMVRATSLEPDMSNADGVVAVLGLDLLYRIRVLRTPPGGGPRFDQQLYVQKIDLAGRAGYGWEPFLHATIGVSPL